MNQIKLEVPPYKVCGYTDGQIGLYAIRLGKEVVGYVENEEELIRTMKTLAKTLQLTGAKVEIVMEDYNDTQSR